jgi:ArsR family transcriptional regulator
LIGNDFKCYAAWFKALGDETRVKILSMLSLGERCACNILDEFAISQSTLSYHMKVLCDCGLVNSRRDGIWMRYTINGNSLARLKQFLNGIEPASDMVELRRDCEC